VAASASPFQRHAFAFLILFSSFFAGLSFFSE
jgi:hypothetical protein